MGEVCDARADQYGFCASLYEAVYGERPTPGGSLAELVLALERGEIRPPPPGRRVPTSLRRALLRGLARDPALRWPSMDALLAALGRVLEPRRRWVAPVALAAALVPAAGVWLAWSGPDDPRCDDTALPLRGVWDDERREHAKTAMLATALPYASDAWARIEHDLDGYAGAWALEHAELCKVVRAGTQPSIDTTELRMGCLYERLVALRETVGLLAQANTTRVTNSVALVAGLPAISQCDDVDTLRAERQRPDDPELAARVDALREQLSKAARLDLAGEYDQALRMVDQLLAEAEALEHAPLPAELRLLEGKTLNHQGRFAEAGRELEQGYLLAVEHGLDDVAMVASLELSFALGRQARHDDALRWARAALVLSRGPDRKPVYEAFALRAVGDVMHEQGELAEALEHHRRALAILEQQFGPTHVDVALSLEQIGQTLQEQGEIEDAIAHQRRALAIYEQALGLGHPQTGASRSNLGMMLMEQGDFEGAVEQLRQALTIYEGALGPRHPNVGAAWANLGETLRQQDRLDDALDALRHAHVVFEQALGPAHPDTAKTLAAIGSVLLRKGELEAALEHQQRALASFEDVLGPRHPQVATLLHNIGVVSLQQGDTEQALEHFRRALAINEAALGADHPGIVPMLAAVADVELSQHELPAARAHAERMLSIEEAGGGAPASLAAARWLVARTSWPDPAQRARARALAQQARDAYATLGEDHRDRLAEIDAWLAEPGRR
jgi:tetratricopeptide (TPR) repeat protein